MKWARAQFDVYNYEAVSIMPPDAYIARSVSVSFAKANRSMKWVRGASYPITSGTLRIASPEKFGKTHPDKLIACCAYGANTQCRQRTSTSWNRTLQVIIVGGRRPRNSLPEQREPYVQQSPSRLDREDGPTDPIIIFENYPFTGRGTYLPAFVARTIGESINATKGVSRGEDIWLSFPRTHDDRNIGFDHFQVYFTARMWWGGKDADVEALLDEYCRLFYGPAGPKMKAFFDYCEANYQPMEKEKEKVDTCTGQLFEVAKAAALVRRTSKSVEETISVTHRRTWKSVVRFMPSGST